jgi:hypothetical protein
VDSQQLPVLDNESAPNSIAVIAITS